jgi:hypothetical protein
LAWFLSEIEDVSALGAFNPVACDGDARHTNQVKAVVATMWANDGFGAGLKLVCAGVLDGVNTGFDAAANGFDGAFHSWKVMGGLRVCRGNRGSADPLRDGGGRGHSMRA